MPIQLTPAQLEKQAARRAAKLAKLADATSSGRPVSVQAKLSPEEVERRKVLKRPWVKVSPKDSNSRGDDKRGERRARIVTWNLLAQTLVRRELFPGSDCLKWGERKPMLLAELEYYANSDIICFQECDRLEDLSKSLPGHSFVHAKGHGKLHGLVILYRSDRYKVKASKTIYLDEEELHQGSDDPVGQEGVNDEIGAAQGKTKRGGSRYTKNIGLVVALEDVDKEKEGIIVSTAHLFWHPKYAYERVRQSLILLRNVISFKTEHGGQDWPAIIAGDFNTQPDEATYQIITSPRRPIPREILCSIDDSRFVHHTITKVEEHVSDSIPPSTSGTGTNTPAVADKDDESEGEQEEPQGGVPGTRAPRDDDGIATSEELVRIARGLSETGCKSAYTFGQWGEEKDTFGGRNGFQRSFEGAVPDDLQGGGEPAYTCFTPLFKLTLDYLFMLPHPNLAVTEVLRPGTPEELGEGLPRKGICASDHLAVGCEISW